MKTGQQNLAHYFFGSFRSKRTSLWRVSGRILEPKNFPKTDAKVGRVKSRQQICEPKFAVSTQFSAFRRSFTAWLLWIRAAFDKKAVVASDRFLKNLGFMSNENKTMTLSEQMESIPSVEPEPSHPLGPPVLDPSKALLDRCPGEKVNTTRRIGWR